MTITRVTVERETARRMRRSDLETGEQIRRMRLDAGITRTELALVVDVHRSYIARIESGKARPSLEVLTAIGLALGADLNLRYFPGSGPRLHDRFQAPMIEAMLGEIHARWLVGLEISVTQPARGVIDMVLTDRNGSTVVAVEVQSELRSLEQQLRWSAEKADGLAQKLRGGMGPGGIGPGEVVRLGGIGSGGLGPGGLGEVGGIGRGVVERPVSRLLVLRSTVATREIARRYRAILAAAYTARTEAVVRALTAPDVPWPGAGIVWMQVEGSKATLMRFPPRGVELGR
jgi:transcriptional regulator with XRE-family HTH domain